MHNSQMQIMYERAFKLRVAQNDLIPKLTGTLNGGSQQRKSRQRL